MQSLVKNEIHYCNVTTKYVVSIMVRGMGSFKLKWELEELQIH